MGGGGDDKNGSQLDTYSGIPVDTCKEAAAVSIEKAQVCNGRREKMLPLQRGWQRTTTTLQTEMLRHPRPPDP